MAKESSCAGQGPTLLLRHSPRQDPLPPSSVVVACSPPRCRQHLERYAVTQTRQQHDTQLAQGTVNRLELLDLPRLPHSPALARGLLGLGRVSSALALLCVFCVPSSLLLGWKTTQVIAQLALQAIALAVLLGGWHLRRSLSVRATSAGQRSAALKKQASGQSAKSSGGEYDYTSWARALESASSGLGVLGASTPLITTWAIKIQHAHVEDLPPDLHSNIEAVLKSHGIWELGRISVRPGCVEMLVEMRLNRALPPPLPSSGNNNSAPTAAGGAAGAPFAVDEALVPLRHAEDAVVQVLQQLTDDGVLQHEQQQEVVVCLTSSAEAAAAPGSLPLRAAWDSIKGTWCIQPASTGMQLATGRFKVSTASPQERLSLALVQPQVQLVGGCGVDGTNAALNDDILSLDVLCTGVTSAAQLERSLVASLGSRQVDVKVTKCDLLHEPQGHASALAATITINMASSGLSSCLASTSNLQWKADKSDADGVASLLLLQLWDTAPPVMQPSASGGDGLATAVAVAMASPPRLSPLVPVLMVRDAAVAADINKLLEQCVAPSDDFRRSTLLIKISSALAVASRCGAEDACMPLALDCVAQLLALALPKGCKALCGHLFEAATHVAMSAASAPGSTTQSQSQTSSPGSVSGSWSAPGAAAPAPYQLPLHPPSPSLLAYVQQAGGAVRVATCRAAERAHGQPGLGPLHLAVMSGSWETVELALRAELSWQAGAGAGATNAHSPSGLDLTAAPSPASAGSPLWNVQEAGGVSPLTLALALPDNGCTAACMLAWLAVRQPWAQVQVWRAICEARAWLGARGACMLAAKFCGAYGMQRYVQRCCAAWYKVLGSGADEDEELAEYYCSHYRNVIGTSTWIMLGMAPLLGYRATRSDSILIGITQILYALAHACSMGRFLRQTRTLRAAGPTAAGEESSGLSSSSSSRRCIPGPDVGVVRSDTQQSLVCRWLLPGPRPGQSAEVVRLMYRAVLTSTLIRCIVVLATCVEPLHMPDSAPALVRFGIDLLSGSLLWVVAEPVPLRWRLPFAAIETFANYFLYHAIRRRYGVPAAPGPRAVMFFLVQLVGAAAMQLHTMSSIRGQRAAQLRGRAASAATSKQHVQHHTCSKATASECGAGVGVGGSGLKSKHD